LSLFVPYGPAASTMRAVGAKINSRTVPSLRHRIHTCKRLTSLSTCRYVGGHRSNPTALRGAGRLDVVAGSVGGADACEDAFVVDVLPRGRTLHSSERYDWIVTCWRSGLRDSASRAAR
jgi:uncharacterized NAD(P)/FAD-binding protein YdhS